MWLLLSGEIPNLVVPWLMNGDNLPDAIMDMYNLHSFTQERGGFGPNVQNLMVLSVFADWRQDLPSKKDLPDAMRNKALEEQENIIEMALVIAQSSWSLAVATLMKYEAKVDTHVSLDGHSFPATQQFESLGINVVNITTAKLMIEAIRNGGYLDDSLETMIVGVDFGNLSLAWKLSQEEGFKLGIIHKKRTPIPDGTSSTTVHELVYGDVRGKRVIVMDDMIGSGGTILKTVKLLLQHGAAEIIVCAAHAVFAGREYYEQLQEVLSNDKVKLIMVSDTLPLERPARGGDKDLPYVFVKRDGQKEQRKVQILETDDFISYIVGVMLLNPTAQAITETMGVHVLQQVDPYDLYYQITGKKMPRPVATVRYREGGQFDRP
jgi:phosphoribosylpyrophosphate synthetase